MQVNNALADGKPQATAAFALVSGAKLTEAFKYLCEIVLTETHTFIFDDD